jgi:Zn-dependent protease
MRRHLRTLLRCTNGVCASLVAFSLLRPLFEADTLQLVLGIVLLIISLGCHEAAHAWVALRCGDTTARDLGRLTLNPIVHIDLIWTIVLPILTWLTMHSVFGGAKPVPVDYHRLRHPLRDMSLVALAGPLSNLLLAILFALLWKVFVTTGFYNGAADTPFERRHDLLPLVMRGAVYTNVLLAVFNMVPVPPLDGSRVMTWLLPPGLRETYANVGAVGMILVLLLLQVPAFNRFLQRSVVAVHDVINWVVSAGGVW